MTITTTLPEEMTAIRNAADLTQEEAAAAGREHMPPNYHLKLNAVAVHRIETAKSADGVLIAALLKGYKVSSEEIPSAIAERLRAEATRLHDVETFIATFAGIDAEKGAATRRLVESMLPAKVDRARRSAVAA